ncbi:YraN family protein [Francisella frigiditurris]|uniref:UPF0102 protein KX01_40 n=1 Tax=Francisella frigiditurris TaxID=1542390 RepID=A0A1J0KTF6_9GAMM|nr:YraN family protein [Francisella frigiditurris]APC97045.1 nuclease-related domain protein [Francisella frigiditurris]
MLKTEIGALGEDKAVNFLKSKSFEIIDKNYKALPYGEIDLIALDDQTLVFVEVKYRKSVKFGTTEEMISISKQKKIINTAQIFLQQNESFSNYECRFDVIAITNNEINWIRAAFNSN